MLNAKNILNKFIYFRNGIANASNAVIVPKHLIQSLLVMVQIAMFTVKLVMAKNGDLMDMVSLVVQDSFKLMV